VPGVVQCHNRCDGSKDSEMSSFDFGVQFLDPQTMTYWGKRYDANFWIENASLVWKEVEASRSIRSDGLHSSQVTAFAAR